MINGPSYLTQKAIAIVRVKLRHCNNNSIADMIAVAGKVIANDTQYGILRRPIHGAYGAEEFLAEAIIDNVRLASDLSHAALKVPTLTLSHCSNFC